MLDDIEIVSWIQVYENIGHQIYTNLLESDTLFLQIFIFHQLCIRIKGLL